MESNRKGTAAVTCNEKPMTRTERVEYRIEQTRVALERNLGTITEQDWRDALARDLARLAELKAAG
jgi:hypothetical protein